MICSRCGQPFTGKNSEICDYCENVTENLSPILKRSYLFLEDEDWENAEKCAEKELDQNPENAQAYLCKLLVEMQVKKQGDLGDCLNLSPENGYYQKIMRFGDPKLRETMEEYVKSVKYKIGSEKLSKARLKEEFEEAKKLFLSIPGYMGADQKAKTAAAGFEQLVNRANDLYDRYRLIMEYDRLTASVSLADQEINHYEKMNADYDSQSIIVRGSQNEQIKLQKKLDGLNDKINKLQQEKGKLGLFHGKEKKALQAQIDELLVDCDPVRRDLTEATEKYDNEKVKLQRLTSGEVCKKKLEELQNRKKEEGKQLCKLRERMNGIGDIDISELRRNIAYEAHYPDSILRDPEKYQFLCKDFNLLRELIYTGYVDTVYFGEYTSEDKATKGKKYPIEWYVNSRTEQVELFSKCIITNRAFAENWNREEPHPKHEDAKRHVWDQKWAESDIRSWLNGDFYRNSFTENEKKRIVQKEIDQDGMQSKDYVRLMSAIEWSVCKRFGLYQDEVMKLDGSRALGWWTRSFAKEGKDYGWFRYDEVCTNSSSLIQSDSLGIRPMITLDLSDKTKQ